MEIVNIMLYSAYLLVFVAALGAIVLPLINAIGHPKSLLKSVVGVVGIGVVYLIGWAISGDEVTAKYIQAGVNTTSSKVIGGFLISTYLLGALALISIVYSEISKIIR